MMKKNKLYTVNRFNKPMFEYKKNIFKEGGLALGSLPSGVSVMGNYQSPTIGIDTNKFNQQVNDTGNFVNGYAAGLKNTSASNIGGLKNFFSAKNFGAGTIGGAAIGAGAELLGGLANNTISGGLSSGAGSTISSLGSTVGGAIGAVNPILGAAVGVGSQLVGGLVNRAFGIKENTALKKEVEAGISQNKNFVSNASSFDDIEGPQAMVSNTNVYKGGWFSKGKARRKNRKLRQSMIAARDWANRSVDNNVDNLIDDQMNDALANYAAYGGPLFNDNNNMGAIEYGFMSDYLTNKKQQTEQKNQLTNMFMGTPSTMFDFGGDLQVHGADWPTKLTHIDAGKSHEENPYDGVQMGADQEGTPNLVEEGETVYDDYVFSNRILADEATKKLFRLPKKKDITFADISKKLEKEIAERPNDVISQAGFKAQMQALEEQQERQKQEMEAERAKAAFEALSPEEQQAVMQQVSQQEAMAQQAAMQQPSPEEMQMMRQQQAMQADDSQAMVGQEPPMMAKGGRLFSRGGETKKRIYKLLGIHTDSEFNKWTKDNNIAAFQDRIGDIAWDRIFENSAFVDALSKDNPALADAISRGYDFGAYKPLENGKTTIKSISKGNWKATNGAGWLGSDDPAWLEATKDMSEDDIKKLSTEDVAKLMRATNSYKKGTEWLQNKDNALLYLNTLLNDADTPQVAKDYAAKFIKDGQWKDGFNYDYATVFGSNGKGVRETNPGTYWHTPVEATRGAQAQNWVINDDGSVEEIIGDVPTDWIAAGNYSWATPENDMTYNYYRRPTAVITGEVPAPTPTPEEPTDEKVEPKLRAEWPRYLGLFGPAVGLGMQIAGIGKPDYGKLNAAVEAANDVHLADYKPLGNYLTYRPMDIWYEQNRMDANARATDRAIMNNASPIGTKMAGLLASGYNNQIASGELYRKALEYNDAKRKDVAEFNRGTDQFNAEAYNRTSQFNADAQNRARQYRAGLAMQAATERLNRDAGWYNSLYGNVAGLFKGISDLGRENAQMNMIARGAADGVYGNLGDSYTGKKVIEQGKANGGKVRRKRGLTY